jgi:hypothetical protein
VTNDEPSRYRTRRLRPGSDSPSHVFISANSLAWNPATAEQGGTVLIGSGVITAEQGDTTRLPEPAAIDPETTGVIAWAPAPRASDLDEVERELHRPARQDPPIYAGLVAEVGLPNVTFLARMLGDRATTSWPIATQEVETRA